MFFSSNSPKEIEEESNCNNDSNLNNLENKEFNTFKYPKNVNSYKFIEKPSVTHFNEAVIVDIVKSNLGYTITLLDTHSRFAISDSIERIEKMDILDHIKKLWIDVFKTPYTFICCAKTAVSTILKNDEDPTIPILFLDENWVVDHLNEYYRIFTDNFFSIMKDTNCSMSVAALWASSVANSTSATSEKQPPAFCAFQFIPLLPCIKGYKPPRFDTTQHYDEVLNNYFNALKMSFMRRKEVSCYHPLL